MRSVTSSKAGYCRLWLVVWKKCHSRVLSYKKLYRIWRMTTFVSIRYCSISCRKNKSICCQMEPRRRRGQQVKQTFLLKLNCSDSGPDCLLLIPLS
jgi:hypothetical protein